MAGVDDIRRSVLGTRERGVAVGGGARPVIRQPRSEMASWQVGGRAWRERDRCLHELTGAGPSAVDEGRWRSGAITGGEERE
jgi:hypothetical protein